MNLKTYFSKKLLFQQSLRENELWTEEKFDLFRETPLKPTNDHCMLGFIRHITRFSHAQKKYLINKVNIPVGIIQKYEIQLEKSMSVLWSSVLPAETDLGEIQKQNNSTEIDFPDNISEILSGLFSNTRQAIEVKRSSSPTKTTIKEDAVINEYASSLSEYFSGYSDFIAYLVEYSWITEVLVDDDKNRLFVVGEGDKST